MVATLLLSARTRDTAEYKSELGNTIVNFARIVPDGVLVFFPSYTVPPLCSCRPVPINQLPENDFLVGAVQYGRMQSTTGHARKCLYEPGYDSYPFIGQEAMSTEQSAESTHA